MHTLRAELTRTGRAFSAVPTGARFLRRPRAQYSHYIEELLRETIHPTRFILRASIGFWPLEPKAAGNSFLKPGGLAFFRECQRLSGRLPPTN
jgi:hypothetical protein